MWIGDKMATEGHRIRKEVADMIESEGFPVDFYGSRGVPVGYGQETKCKVLADYAFSICTETCYEENLFTEWLLDCFALGTIPIYWGCPNTDGFFDDSGILKGSSVKNIESILYDIEHGHEVISEFDNERQHNLAIMQDYAITEDWLYLNVLKEFE